MKACSFLKGNGGEYIWGKGEKCGELKGETGVDMYCMGEESPNSIRKKCKEKEEEEREDEEEEEEERI